MNRYKVIESRFTAPVSAAAGVELVAIWDEDSAQIIAWARADAADTLATNLNEGQSNPDSGVTIKIVNKPDGDVDITASFQPKYRGDGNNPPSHDAAISMFDALKDAGEVKAVETDGRRLDTSGKGLTP